MPKIGFTINSSSATWGSCMRASANNFRIRHHETSKHSVPDSNARDYLFARLPNLIIFLLNAAHRLESRPARTGYGSTVALPD